MDDLVFNGIDPDTGDYLRAPCTVEDLAAGIRAHGSGRPEAMLVSHLAGRKSAKLGVKYGVDPSNLAQAGWALLLAGDEDPAVLDALQPLIRHRRDEAGETLTRVFSGTSGYASGWSVEDLFRSTGAAAGPVEPEVLPYYILIAGPPSRIPFEFQQRLDLQYAVGRICFDTPAAYGRYAANVLRAEGRTPDQVDRSYAVVGPDTAGDPATNLSSRYLLEPLAKALAADVPGWRQTARIGAPATKDTYRQLLAGPGAPPFVFSASHGAGFPAGHLRQRDEQGSLVCQGWGGPHHPLSRDHQFAASDLEDGDDLTGRIAFLFACYGAGTPELDAFTFEGSRPRIAPEPFVAALPQRMLSLEKGALACVGHVDRAWGTSFLGSGRHQIEMFRSAIHQLLDGGRLGACVEHVNLKYADEAARLLEMLQTIHYGGTVDARELTVAWTAANDARFYTLFGDPAVRLTA